MIDIVFLHLPTIYNKPIIPNELKKSISELEKFGNVHNYFFKFSYYKNKFNLTDFEFENVSDDIHDTYKNLNKYLLIAVNHSCPFALHYSTIYPEKCLGVICYPFRFYSKESYDRRIWKLKDNNGWQMMIKNSKYTFDDYLLNVTEERFSELFSDPNDDEKTIIWLNMDLSLQRQYYKIPKIMKVYTVLYTRFDLDVPSIIEHNYNRRDVAKMKQIINENDALYNSMIWNFDRVKYDAILKKENEGNMNLKIKYLVSGWEDDNDLVDEVILFMNKNRIKNIEKNYIVKLDTFEDGLKYMNQNIGKDCKWIYDLIDGKGDRNRVLYENKNFVLVTEMSMKSDDMRTFHPLAFPKDKSIRSIRDLTSDHIPLLREMVYVSKKFIKDNYELNESEIEAHFHYPPGVLLLHMHFEMINNNAKVRRPLREHSVHKVIENLLIDNDYYKKITLDIIEKK